MSHKFSHTGKIQLAYISTFGSMSASQTLYIYSCLAITKRVFNDLSRQFLMVNLVISEKTGYKKSAYKTSNFILKITENDR